jgi:hypothetical protein
MQDLPHKSITLQIIYKSVSSDGMIEDEDTPLHDHCMTFHLPELAISWIDAFLAMAVVNPVSAHGPTLLNLQMANTGLAALHIRLVYDDDGTQ